MTNFTKYMRLLALGITFSASMALPYVHIKFYDVIREATQATNNELGLLMTIFTGVGMLLYIPGGVIAEEASDHLAGDDGRSQYDFRRTHIVCDGVAHLGAARRFRQHDPVADAHQGRP